MGLAATTTELPDVLLLDDDYEFVALLSESLERCCRRIRTAADSSEALVAIASSLPDVLVSDFRLSASETAEPLLVEIKKRWPDLGIVLLTGSQPHEYQQLICTCSINLVLRKPVRLPELVQAIGTTREKASD